MNSSNNKLPAAAQQDIIFLTYVDSGFSVRLNQQGEKIYHWIDSPISELSSVKLLKMIRIIEELPNEQESHFLTSIKEELARRTDNITWHPPH